jgi:excisionase family DNA binding protein
VTLTPKQAAARAGVSLSLVYAWCDDRLLPHYRFGRAGKRGRILIEEADLAAFLADQQRPSRPNKSAPAA